MIQYFYENTKRTAFQANNPDMMVRDLASSTLKRIVSQYPYEAPDGELSLKTEAAAIKFAKEMLKWLENPKRVKSKVPTL